MGNEPLSGDLPGHLQGRGSQGGPMAGAYVCINIGINTVAAAQTDLEVGAVSLPFDMRIESITLSCTSSTGGATRGTVQVTDGTNDILAADTLLVSAGSAVVEGSDLVAAQRTRAKADRLQVDVTTPASEVITAFNCCIAGYVRGHVNDDSADD